VTRPQVYDPLGLALRFGQVSKLAHAADGFAGERSLVKVADPRRRRFSGRFRERVFGPSQQSRTRRAVFARLAGDTAGFQREQARLKAGIGSAGAQYRLSLSGELDCFVGLAEVAGEVASAAEHVRAKLLVAADLSECERASEVLFGYVIASSVVRHPAGHFRQGSGSGEDRASVRATIRAEQAGRDIRVEVFNNAGVQVPAADLQVSRTECMHGRRIGIVQRAVTDWHQLKRCGGWHGN
jgi:hypothetical protein